MIFTEETDLLSELMLAEKPHVLLVCGARSLDEHRTPEQRRRSAIAEGRFRIILEHFLRRNNIALVISGSALRGPDRWAIEVATPICHVLPMPVLENEYPLARNRRMAMKLIALRSMGMTCMALGFGDRASRTSGTAHMLTLCKNSKIPYLRLDFKE